MGCKKIFFCFGKNKQFFNQADFFQPGFFQGEIIKDLGRGFY